MASRREAITAVPDDPLLTAPEAVRVGWGGVLASLRRPYRVTLSMVVLVALVPFYIFIPELISARAFHVPELAWDRTLPLWPSWALVYGSVYLFLILLPVLVVRQEAAIRRAVRAYLMVWITAYVCFLLYPTMAPRPPKVLGEGFGDWGLRLLYSADPPYNCFPSLHVAHSFVSALVSWRVHRGVGIAAALGALLVGLSTLFTKQHYLLDVLTGMLLAFLAGGLFLRGDRGEEAPDLDRRLAPFLALGIAGLLGLVVGGSWVAYRKSLG